MTKQKKIGVMLINLGTPESPSPLKVYRYLNEFLTDPRVIDIPWIFRQPLVRGVISPIRCWSSAKMYRHIWFKEGSPLLIYGQSVVKKLQKALGDQFDVKLAMRYQKPSIKGVLNEFKGQSINDLLILPLFPQYSSATTGSIFEEVMRQIKKWKFFPALSFVQSFSSHPAFLSCFLEMFKKYPFEEFDCILFSYHGLPVRQVDSLFYAEQCVRTTQEIVKSLKIPESQWVNCFQSRLGKEPWLRPYASEVLEKCATNGMKKLLVCCPSFVCDCLETMFEIGIEYQKLFRSFGGEKITLVEGLNDQDFWIHALKDIVLEHSLRPNSSGNGVVSGVANRE